MIIVLAGVCVAAMLAFAFLQGRPGVEIAGAVMGLAALSAAAVLISAYVRAMR
ncbi:hypothetical protein [Asanoa ferruginea]|uniref:hypothetical protein n=1 Tax=Asanoa ferruginea TaxID=53367 RepID=UPI00147773F4|nr:hypothetical protein [Asanoa ferruginea]